MSNYFFYLCPLADKRATSVLFSFREHDKGTVTDKDGCTYWHLPVSIGSYGYLLWCTYTYFDLLVRIGLFISCFFACNLVSLVCVSI